MDEVLKNYPPEYQKKVEDLVKRISEKTITKGERNQGLKKFIIDFSDENQYKEIAFKIHNIATQLVIEEGKQEKFIYTENNKKVLKCLMLYFHGSHLFEQFCKDNFDMDASLSKGIFLSGNPGLGKTLIMRIFENYTRKIIQCNTFCWYESMDIRSRFQYKDENDPKDPMNEFYWNIQNDIKYPRTIYINDIANSNEKAWGENIMENVLFYRDKLHVEKGYLTHVSSNYNIHELAQNKIYSDRIIDRVKSMFNMITLEGNSFRK